jgi:hypothetical protein
MFSCDDCGLMFGKLHDLQKYAKKWCSENQRKPTFERKLSTESEDRDQTGSDLAAKAPRWFTDNMQSDRGVQYNSALSCLNHRCQGCEGRDV